MEELTMEDTLARSLSKLAGGVNELRAAHGLHAAVLFTSRNTIAEAVRALELELAKRECAVEFCEGDTPVVFWLMKLERWTLEGLRRARLEVMSADQLGPEVTSWRGRGE